MYRVKVPPKVEKEILKLVPPTHLENLRKKIVSLSENPRPFGSKKLKGRQNYRIRLGDYRLEYTIIDSANLVIIVRVRHRRDDYKIR
jgi:mRNA interferase RelE/StbE